MAGCVLPLLVCVFLIRVASNSGVMFTGKWTQMIEMLFYEQSESQGGMLGGLLSNDGQSEA